MRLNGKIINSVKMFFDEGRYLNSVDVGYKEMKKLDINSQYDCAVRMLAVKERVEVQTLEENDASEKEIKKLKNLYEK